MLRRAFVFPLVIVIHAEYDVIFGSLLYSDLGRYRGILHFCILVSSLQLPSRKLEPTAERHLSLSVEIERLP